MQSFLTDYKEFIVSLEGQDRKIWIFMIAYKNDLD